MNSFTKLVLQFHEVFKCHTGRTAELPPSDVTKLRIELIQEELDEYKAAVQKGDRVAILDALVDLLYVTFGAVVNHGFHRILDDAFTEVHRSNMSKVTADGKVLYHESGKVLKSDQFTPPDLASLLDLGE